MLQEFKAFVLRGNVLDLAVAVIIGAAFGAIVASLTDDLLMPLLAAMIGSPDFSSNFVLLGPIPDGYQGSLTDYAALKKAGAVMFGYGAFITKIVSFLIIAFAIFMIVRQANKMMPKPAEAPPAGPSEEVLLLRDIRDSLRK
ncbi:large conductance mechanosensitive channel protein MscL [Sandaracinobacteroides saxicola]|uniref:Large-conductance mechanosensitive channel n=1 Tax=Sandaracinobacteroides saxicola TaxID=2759707 RepID=A0A7G5IGX6_9SPHN|nr:large conductance mechanosensitive channel protein MscL [Sandaracinobacteroides saxicola]QMW22618.1 large conductance mechanosensitive channel protein MscL [Sandaracinobacteroides saxicola]